MACVTPNWSKNLIRQGDAVVIGRNWAHLRLPSCAHKMPESDLLLTLWAGVVLVSRVQNTSINATAAVKAIPPHSKWGQHVYCAGEDSERVWPGANSNLTARSRTHWSAAAINRQSGWHSQRNGDAQ
jgi:hypothetical protein